MFQFIESICFIDGKPRLLDYHQKRVNETFSKFFPDHTAHDLSALIPCIPDSEKYKCRVVFDATTFDVEFIRYRLKDINSLKIVEPNMHIDYSYKKFDRSCLDDFYEQRSYRDDILIINRGKVSDSYYANLVFYDGDQWFTSDTPLLNGVKRQHLLSNGTISEIEIQKNDIHKYQKVSLINAMIDLGEIVIPTAQIEF